MNLVFIFVVVLAVQAWPGLTPTIVGTLALPAAMHPAPGIERDECPKFFPSLDD